MDVAFALKWNSMMPQQPLEIRPTPDGSLMRLSRSNQNWKNILATPFNMRPTTPVMSWLQAFSNESILNVCGKCGTSEGVIEECDECEGDGEITCDECDGDGEITCGDCDGEGDFTCEECDGEGTLNTYCEPCDAVGEIRVDCEECGDGVVREGLVFVECEECDGTGEDGDGKQCKTCEGEMQVKCEGCDGMGYLMENCEECDGDGEVVEDCEECDDGLVTCDVCEWGLIDCDECDGDGELECEECNGAWQEDNCNEHQLLKEIMNTQPQIENLQNNLNYSNEKLKFKIFSFKTYDGAKKFADNSNNFCYILTLRNGVKRKLESDWRITVESNLGFPANRLVELYYVGGLYLYPRAISYIGAEKWINTGITLVLKTNISFKDGNFLNWDTDSPWIS